MEIEDNIQWHPAFCSAMELELRSYKQYLRYEREHSLSKMPLRIDFLVIKKDADVPIENEIGNFFLRTNVFEYKSPGDTVNVGTFYKALAYACLHKAEEQGVDESIDMDTTVSIVREEKPSKLLGQLGEKFSIAQTGKGIYRVGGLLFPVQFIVTKELDNAAHIWISSLTRTMDRSDAQSLLNHCKNLEDNEDRENADSVINVASEANIELFKKMIQEGDEMCEELKELLAPEIVEFKKLVEKQKQQLADKDARLADKDARLADKDARLADKDARLADNAAEIAMLKKLLAEATVNA